MIKEEWNQLSFNELDLIPLRNIEEVIGEKVNLNALRDGKVCNQDPQGYNISIMARAHNEGKHIHLQSIINNGHQNKKDVSIRLQIELPQVKVFNDTENISLHLTQLNTHEIFINDIVLLNKDHKTPIGHDIFMLTLENINTFAKLQGIKVISGYAASKQSFEKFKAKGFLPDKRNEMKNDWLWKVSRMTGVQIPFYKQIK